MFNHKVLYNVIVFLADKSISLIQLCKNNTLCIKQYNRARIINKNSISNTEYNLYFRYICNNFVDKTF